MSAIVYQAYVEPRLLSQSALGASPRRGGAPLTRIDLKALRASCTGT